MFLSLFYVANAVQLFAQHVPEASLVIREQWRFCPDEANEGTGQGWYSETWDDSAWAVVTAGVSLTSQGHTNTSVAWYRKSVQVPADWSGHRVMFGLWGGSQGGGSLYLNGQYHAAVGKKKKYFDISSSLGYGDTNLFAIKFVDSSTRDGINRGPVVLLVDDLWIPIGLGQPLPVKDEPVEVTVYGDGGAPAAELTVTDPDGQPQVLALTPTGTNGDSCVTWTPARCGQHSLAAGSEEVSVWVVRAPMFFHWWDGSLFSEYATDVMINPGQWPGRIDAWVKRGVATVTWAGGTYLASADRGANQYTTPEQWLNNWLRAVTNRTICHGFALDEMCLMPNAPHSLVAEALESYAELRPDDRIGIYLAGADDDAGETGRAVDRSGGMLMIESYWGNRATYESRWDKISKVAGAARTIFTLSGGYTGTGTSGQPKTIANVLNEVTWVRQIAPDSPGLGFFNAYGREDLDALTDGIIEDYFLKPIFHVELAGTSIHIRNIGNADAVDCALRFDDEAEQEVTTVTVPTLAAGETFSLLVPAGVATMHQVLPAGMINLYSDPLSVAEVYAYAPNHVYAGGSRDGYDRNSIGMYVLMDIDPDYSVLRFGGNGHDGYDRGTIGAYRFLDYDPDYSVSRFWGGTNDGYDDGTVQGIPARFFLRGSLFIFR